MLSMPSEAMNGGRRMRVTRRPMIAPVAMLAQKPTRIASTPGTWLVAANWAMTICARIIAAPIERSIPAVRMIERLGHAQPGDHGDLLEHERDVRRREEARVDEPEDDERDHQDDERAERGMGVKPALEGDPGVLSRAVRPSSSSTGARCGSRSRRCRRKVTRCGRVEANRGHAVRGRAHRHDHGRLRRTQSGLARASPSRASSPR